MSNKKALIVVDMQNDYLWNRRKKMFSYNTPELVNAVNSLISEFSERGDDVIYVGQVFPNIITNKWFIGFSIKGTSGAEIYPDVDIVSDNYFEKNLPNSFTSRSFKSFVTTKEYSESLDHLHKLGSLFQLRSRCTFGIDFHKFPILMPCNELPVIGNLCFKA